MSEYITHEHDVLIIGAGGAGLRAAIEVSARGRFLPMSAPIGPRLPAVLVDLWS